MADRDESDPLRPDLIRALKARLATDPRVLPRLREIAKESDDYRPGRAAAVLKELESVPAQAPQAGPR